MLPVVSPLKEFDASWTSLPVLLETEDSEYMKSDVERQARPDPPASRRTEKHTKNINARDPQDSRRQEESGLTFGRAEHFTFHFLLDFTGAYPLFDHPRLHRAPLLGSTTPTSNCTARTFNIRLASKSNPFDSNPLSFLSSLSFLVT